jgi:branched-chain amino acid aminotransferase
MKAIGMRGISLSWGVRSHAAWLGSSVFDGARTFEGVTRDLDLHCARVNASAEAMHLHPVVSVETWAALTRDGIKRFDPGTALYIRPLYWAEHSGALLIAPDPESTKWCLTLYEAPMRTPDGFSITLSPYRKPSIETMPTDAKAGYLYPNNARALIEAQRRGFGNCVVLDTLGNVAELATASLFIAKDGVVLTPAPNGTFLNGITRQRVIKLLRSAGVSVVKRRCTIAISATPTRYSPPATIPRWCRSTASTSAHCSPVRSIARRASFTGLMRIHEAAPASRLITAAHR